MALVSPGVEVTIIDQSQYLPAPTNSVPLVVLATAQNKANPNGIGVAAATTAANANKLYQVTSQRDLVSLYGSPFFYTSTNGTPIQGYELNEYGLLAAYSLLNVTNRCYVLRADIDLASLVGRTGRPVGEPANATYWLDTTNSTWGIYEFNAATGEFELQNPIVITESSSLSGGVPLNSIGNIGDYAINAIQPTTSPLDPTGKTYFYKSSDNTWVVLGGNLWEQDITCAQGTESPTTLSAGDTFDINVSGLYTVTIQVPNSPNNTLDGVAAVINAFDTPAFSARVVSGKIQLTTRQHTISGPTYLGFTEGSGTALADMGILEQNYYSPAVVFGTSAQMPLWTASQTNPRPTGSVWIKVGSTGNGLSSVFSQYSTSTASWISKNLTYHTSDFAAIASLDSTGGQLIPAGAIYGQYDFNGTLASAPYYIWERIATGPTVVTGTNNSFNFTTGPAVLTVNVSVPSSSILSNDYTITVPDNSDASDFVAAWQSAGIPYTSASVTTDGAIQLVHTVGGCIYLNDCVNGISNGLIAEAGFEIGTNTEVKYGGSISTEWNGISSTTDNSGTNAEFDIITFNGSYILNGTGISSGGSGYNLGDEIYIDGADLGGLSTVNDLTLVVTEVSAGAITGVSYVSGSSAVNWSALLSNWREITYTSNEGAPVANPANNTNWFYSVIDEVDIMVQKGGSWIGYKNTAYDLNGHPAASGSNVTDPNGPIISASIPTTQSDGTPLEYGDIWIDSSNLETYPVIYRWQEVSTVNQWVLINNTDQVSSNGIVFADARWATNGTTNVTNDPIPTITSLLTSNYLDLDAPEPSLYPQGMLLFNTRRSGYNVKQFRVNYFSGANFPGQSLPTEANAWVTVSGNQANGAPFMGRKAQRAMVVQALRSAIDTNTSIRDEDNFFNLMATPNYPELQPNMVDLNSARGETAFIIGDTPLGLPDQATAIQAWANNSAGASSTGEEGCVTRNTYLGLFYPSGLATDLSGNEVVVPASHMMLRTFLRNDTVAYPWFAPAGTRRGNIENALNIGYLDRTTGEFQPIKTSLGIRDVLYINQINPMVFFTGVGLLNYGNKSSFASQSALDRINVARLVNYVRRQLTIAARPFVFEPNDALTRNQIAGVIQTLLVDLVAKRGVYDYLVVCDESNNTPARIDRNELWVDVAIEPVKAAEFIYVPVRVLNTGELQAGV